MTSRSPVSRFGVQDYHGHKYVLSCSKHSGRDKDESFHRIPAV